jgi:hypothetical protein
MLEFHVKRQLFSSYDPFKEDNMFYQPAKTIYYLHTVMSEHAKFYEIKI